MIEPPLVQQITGHLDDLGLAYRLSTHAPVTTSEDAARVRGVDLASGAKALLIKSRQGLTLFVLSASMQLDWKGVKKILRDKSARLTTEEELYKATGLLKGSVPPFGNLLGIPVFVDPSILRQATVRFNAGSLTQSIEMSGEDLLTAIEGQTAYFSKLPSGRESNVQHPAQ